VGGGALIEKMYYIERGRGGIMREIMYYIEPRRGGIMREIIIISLIMPPLPPSGRGAGIIEGGRGGNYRGWEGWAL
jgi:hypothetical protein